MSFVLKVSIYGDSHRIRRRREGREERKREEG